MIRQRTHHYRPTAERLESRRMLAAQLDPVLPEPSELQVPQVVDTTTAAAALPLTNTPHEVRYGLTSTQYNNEVATLQSQGLRPYQVSGYQVNGTTYYAAVWRPTGSTAWQARHGMTASEYQSNFDSFVSQGYRLSSVDGYTVNGIDRYAAVWEKVTGTQWYAHHRITASQFDTLFNQYASQGIRPIQISGYAIGSNSYYAALWRKESGGNFLAHSKLTQSEFDTKSSDYSAAGYHLANVSVYTIGGVNYFAGIWEQDASADVLAGANMTSSQLQSRLDALDLQGYRLLDVKGYASGAAIRYAASWGKSVSGFTSLPVSGTQMDSLSPVIDVVEQFMVENQIPAGTVAISKDGTLLTEVGLGWSDQDRTTPIQPDAMFRLASVVKPMTDAAVTRLVDQGLIDWNDQVFCVAAATDCLLDITPFQSVDPRVSQITVEHLIEHTAGWDRDISGDPLFQAIFIAQQLGVASPPSQEQIASYMLGHSLDFDPGSRFAYSNFGYLLLGLIVEDVTGRDYTEFLQNEIFAGVGVDASEIELGRTLPGDRNPREPWYSDPYVGPNVFNPTETVAFPNGGYHLESMESLGGQIASARAVNRFMDGYWISGDPRTSGQGDYYFFGSLAGTATMARQRFDGVNVTVLFNKRTDPSFAWFDMNVLRSRVDSVLNGITISVVTADRIGFYQPDASLYHLKDTFTAGASDQYFAFGPGGNAGWVPLTGDWNGNGVDTIGLYDPAQSVFHLKDSFAPGAADHYFAFGPGGNAGWIPLAGDWNGDGVDTIGLYQPELSLFHLKNSFGSGASDQYFAFGPGGNAGWTPLVGDWNGDGIDTIGLYQPDISLFHLKDSFTPGASDHYFAFGPGNSGWRPMTGDWDGNGTDTIGLYQPDVSLFHLKNSFTPGASDHYFAFGPAGNVGWVPLSGDWNGPVNQQIPFGVQSQPLASQPSLQRHEGELTPQVLDENLPPTQPLALVATPRVPATETDETQLQLLDQALMQW